MEQRASRADWAAGLCAGVGTIAMEPLAAIGPNTGPSPALPGAAR